MILVVSASLRTESNSRVMAREAMRILELDRVPSTLVDLRDHPLPLCDAGASYGDPNVDLLRGLLAKAAAVLVATPIYNYGANAAVKNLIELTGSGWEDKPVGFLCAAGGMSSYMSVLSLANSLMLDFRSLIIPRFVYATGDAFGGGRITDADVAERVAVLAREGARLGRMLRAA